jgi:hypothetical protein
MPHLENPNPKIYTVSEISRNDALDDDDARDTIDSLEVFGMCYVLILFFLL